MADIHIDDFCRDTARTLLQLYGAFPRPQAVYVEDIAGPDEPDDVGLHSRRHMACLGTLLWLGDEGYLRHTGLIYQDGIEQAVLTQRAFLVLSHILHAAALPHSDAAAPMAEALRNVLRTGTSADITTLVRHFLALGGKQAADRRGSGAADDTTAANFT